MRRSKGMDNYLGIITTIIAVIGAYIAYQQQKINKHKLRLDLYDRRLNIYRSIMNFISTVTQDGEVNIEDIIKYKVLTSDAEFLFDKEVKEMINEIYNNALKFRKKNIKNMDDTDLLAWFTEQYDTVNEIFQKYLSFKEIKN